MATKAIKGFPLKQSNFTFSGGGWKTERPLSNIGVLPLSRVARTNSLSEANMQFVVTSNVGLVFANLFGFVRHSGTVLSSFRMKFFDDTARSSEIYDTEIRDLWPTAYSVYDDNFLRPNFFCGKYSPDEIAGQIPTSAIYLPDLPPWEAAEVYFYDDDNPAGYFDLGYFTLEQGVPSTVNFQYGARFGLRSLDKLNESDGGSIRVDERQAKRVFRGNVAYLPMDEVKTREYEHQRQLKSVRPFIWMPFPDDVLHQGRDTFLARHAELGLFDYTAAARAGVPLNLEEITDY